MYSRLPDQAIMIHNVVHQKVLAAACIFVMLYYPNLNGWKTSCSVGDLLRCKVRHGFLCCCRQRSPQSAVTDQQSGAGSSTVGDILRFFEIQLTSTTYLSNDPLLGQLKYKHTILKLIKLLILKPIRNLNNWQTPATQIDEFVPETCSTKCSRNGELT